VSPRTWLLAAFVVGCSRHHGLPPAFEGQRAILEAALGRRPPPRLHGKLTIKARSELLGIAGSTGGALFLDRPGRGHLAIFGPLGGPMMTAQTDGTGLAVAMMREREHLVSADADAVLHQTLGEELGLDEVLGLLEGQLPFDEADITDALRRPDGDLELQVKAARGTRARVVLDDLTGTPVSIEVVGRGDEALFSATYAPFEPMVEGGPLLPSAVTLTVPKLDLVLELKARSWDVPDEVPEVFGLAPPEGFTSGPLESLFPSTPR
jgi:hypothetical protein